MKWIFLLSVVLDLIGVVIWMASLDISYSYCKDGICWRDSWELVALLIVGYLIFAISKMIWGYDE